MVSRKDDVGNDCSETEIVMKELIKLRSHTSESRKHVADKTAALKFQNVKRVLQTSLQGCENCFGS